MSRVAKAPIAVPSSVQLSINGQSVAAKGPVGELIMNLNAQVKADLADGVVTVAPSVDAPTAWAQAGTARALIANMVRGVSEGFERKLQLIGVGYKAAVQGDVVNLSLGFSHPVNYKLPLGVQAVATTPTELVIKGANKQAVGQTAAEIRAYRPPEPYKGKGVRYFGERVVIKETKKK